MNIKKQKAKNESYKRFVRYNANSRGSNVGDCTKRAISLAFDIDYRTVEKEMHNHLSSSGRWNNLPCLSATIKALGGPDCEDVRGQGYTVRSYMESHDDGVYIFHTEGTHGEQGSQHLVCAINGILYDSWDSSDMKLLRVWVLDGGREEYSHAIEGHLKELAEIAYDDIWERLETVNSGNRFVTVRGKVSYQGDYGFVLTDVTYCPVEDRVEGSNQVTCKSGCKIHNTKIAYMFSPKDTIDTAKDKILKINAEKVAYFIKRIDAEIQEVAKTSQYNVQLYDKREERFFNSLPVKIRPYVREVDLDGGYYYDCGVTFDIPEWDNEHRGLGRVRIESETQDDVKRLVKRYLATGELPDNNEYDSWEEEACPSYLRVCR